LCSTCSTTSLVWWGYPEAIELFGLYSAVTYVAYIPGGFVADRLTGAKNAVLIGGLMACGGCALLALPYPTVIYPGLAVVTLGVGLMRPSLWTMLGRVYAPGDARRDNGFSVLFVGVNVGAGLSALAVVNIGHTYGWSDGFGLAAGALLVGQGVYT
jgi:POT family proton-dependent oligopeptide transporter